jgi:hypothetical protein
MPVIDPIAVGTLVSFPRASKILSCAVAASAVFRGVKP